MATKRKDSDEEDEPPPKRKPSGNNSTKGHWMLGLIKTMKNPEMIVQEDDLCVTIKDAYPKAHHHYLVLPKSDISSLKALNHTHVSLLENMLTAGQNYVDKLKVKDSSLSFKLGYHGVPSMTRLHMHVISQDFDSPCLKNKKHWNSFTTEFFLDASKVIQMLKDNGQITIDKDHFEQLLKLPLKCHVCGLGFPNMPKLKVHIMSHK